MSDRSAIITRLSIVFGLMLLIPVAITLQLLRINIWAGQELRQLWSAQTIGTIPIPAQRGNIYDDDGSLLVTNSVAYNVAIDPQIPELTPNLIDQVCSILAEYSPQNKAYYLQKIRSASSLSRYVELDHDIHVEAYDALQKMGLRALILEEEYQRRYNFGSLAAHVLGFVNYNMEGMIGLEERYNEQLKGTDGVQQVRRGRNGNIFAYLGAPKKLPEQGYSLHTTIDSHIQAILEEELKAGVIESESQYGTAIVINPQTGAVKAMANYPTFNPNQPAAGPKENRRNHMISDVIEPGSTYKLVMAIAALEQGKVSLHEKIKTPPSGQLLINGQWMRDHDPLGTLTFTEVIQKSSNIATAKIAMRLTKDTFYQYSRNMGFGSLTGIDLPDEQDGRLRKPYKWSDVSLPWMSIGYEVLVSPLQIAQAYAAFANMGLMMQPYIVDKIVTSKGETVWQHEPTKIRRIAQKETVKKLYPAFKSVVSDSGTANFAQIKGLDIAGKTGTAQKYIDGQYRREYRSSFVGFFPVENPQYVCLVIMDDPEVYPFYGGWVAAPVFHNVSNRIAGLDNNIEKQLLAKAHTDSTRPHIPKLAGLKLPNAKALLKNQNIPYNTTGSGSWVVSQQPEAGTQLKSKKAVTLTLSETIFSADTSEVPKGYAVIPDVDGMSMRQAVRLINKQGFQAKIVGSGAVHTQFPRAGDPMKKGRTVTVRGKTTSLETIATR